MLKQLLLLAIIFFPADKAISKTPDTLLIYYRYVNGMGESVRTLDSADYFMLILPPDSADNRYNIKQFYKNGKIKLIGKAEPGDNSMKTGRILLTGDCITYYPNGRRKSISHYKMGYQDGLEYLYYDNGALQCVRKHILGNSVAYDQTLNWECYDSKGNIICKDGNGRWITYDDADNVILEGNVINGYMEGDWQGIDMHHDSIRYVYTYKKNVIESSEGYDKNGKAYPFTREMEPADYKGGPITFIKIFRNHLRLPKDTSGKKMSVDTVHISFIVEKDGQLDHFEVLGNINPDLNYALVNAINRCKDWMPSRYYGIPYRTRIILPLKFLHGFAGDIYHEEVFFNEKIVGF